MSAYFPDSIGVMDSGVGGLSVLREIHTLLPKLSTLYFADQGHLPYGPRDPEELREFVEEISEFLIARGARMIVLACHSASAASLLPIRARYPHIPFVGIEPAVKPAAERTRTGVIGVLTTRATADGPLYRRVRERFAAHIEVITRIAPELVALVESGDFDTPDAQALVDQAVADMLARGADQVVLACTHFPFLSHLLKRALGDAAEWVDPGPAVARQAARVLPQGMVGNGAPARIYWTSGDPHRLAEMTRRLIGGSNNDEAAAYFLDARWVNDGGRLRLEGDMPPVESSNDIVRRPWSGGVTGSKT